MLKMWIYACTVLTIASAEVVTLINRENVTCVLTGESVYSALYIWPSCKTIKRSPTKELTEWVNDDWNGDEDRMEKMFDPITDIRFEDYKDIHYYRDDLHNYISDVHVYLSVEVKISYYGAVLTIDSTPFQLQNMMPDKKCDWLHFGKIKSTHPRGTTESVAVKFIGVYRARAFKCSENKTPTNESGSYINLSNVSNSNHLCISMFVGIGYNSHLEIILESGNTTVTKTINSNNNYFYKNWHRIEIETYSYNGTGRLYFRRKCNGVSGCFWTVDYIHLCRQTIEVYHQKWYYSHHSDLCKTVDAKFSTSNITCGRTGYIGKYCNISCENVLGTAYSACNHHRICYEGRSCQCAPGYEGEFCDKELPHNTTAGSSDKNHTTTGSSDKNRTALQGKNRNISDSALQENPIKRNYNCTINETKSMDEIGTSFTPTVHIAASMILLLEFILGLIYCCYRYFKKRYRLQMVAENNHYNTIEEAILLKEEYKTMIPLEDFEKCIKEIFLNDAYLTQQFNALAEEKSHSCTNALSSKNSRKNKDQVNVPYDYNRIVLKELDGVGTDDYINASFLNGYNRSEVYITGPGPKFYTVSDFWRMVWQEEVHIIVMATNFSENNERMCAEYWTPRLGTIFECGELTVRIISEKIYEHYDSRTLEVHYTRFRREIRHFHLKWNPVNQNVLYTNAIIPVLKNIREFTQNSTSPIVIHSGFGANRNGTLILCDLALQMAQSEGYVDFYRLLKNMRNQRPNMINEKEYYMLAHLIVLEYLLETEKPFKKLIDDNLSPLAIEQQINYLEKISWQDSIISSWTPEDISDSVLDPAYVDGYGQPRKFVVTKQLTEKVIRDFWYLVAHEKIKSILFLNKPKNNLWPCKTQNAAIVIKVTEKEIHTTSSYNKIQLSLLLYDSITKEILNDSDVWVFELLNWKTSQELPISPYNLVETISDIKTVPFDQERILIGSSGKTSDIGFVLALFYALEKYEKELEIDVCSAVRVVKRSELNFSVKPKHLNFIYLAIKAYLKSFDKYEPMEM